MGQQLNDVAMAVLLAGIASGIDALPPAAATLIDLDLVNEAAIDFMRRFISGDPLLRRGVAGEVTAWIDGVTATTRRQVMSEIERWVRSGDPLDVLQARLAPIFGEARARMIATTEVTRMFASGNLMAWGATGLVQAKRWQTANDERVCPVCGPLHDTIIEIDNPWQFTPEMIAANPELERVLGGLGNSFFAPPAHPNCRCWLQPVVFSAYDPADLARQFFGRVPRLVGT